MTRLGDQYIVVANDNRVLGTDGQENVQPPQGMSCYPLRRARIYALDLAGKPVWPAPVDVDHQQFLLSQPGRCRCCCLWSSITTSIAAQPR